jgi:hypothetical protein
MPVIRFILLLSIKIIARIFYRFEVSWVGNPGRKPFRGANVGVLLNHTSLFEPIFLGVLPLHIVWKVSTRGVLPGADKTLNRPIAGRFFKLIAPQVVSLTRRRDESWEAFMGAFDNDSIVLIAPEGRMKRPNGLDRDGKPMTVRGGIAEILLQMKTGILIATYSGGLHHVQAPGDKFPKLFKTIRVRFERIDIAEFLTTARKKYGLDEKALRLGIARELERLRDLHCAEIQLPTAAV